MIGYLDCFSGVSGDMILGALVDAGLVLEELRQELAALNLTGEYTLSAETVLRGMLRATCVKVVTSGAHPTRRLPDIAAIIQTSDLSNKAKESSLRVFVNLAEAEAHVHGIPVEEIHFHEVGATDTIVDIVGAVLGLEKLGVKQLYASPLPVGMGHIETSHGTLPLPAPGSLELLAMAHAPTCPGPAGVELVTPTGAAILTTLARFCQPPMKVARVGYGAGSRKLDWPNAIRLWIGEELPEHAAAPAVTVLETNLDDMNPEFYGYVMTRLFEVGALDVFLAPIYMKKNRPGTLLTVVARPEDETALADVLLRETSTLGMRVSRSLRYEAERQIVHVETCYGPIQVKLKLLGGKVQSVAPEYEACRAVAAERGVPITEVYQTALQAGRVLLEQERA